MADTTDPTATLIEVSRTTRLTVPTFPQVGTERLLPSLSRITFDRDSIDWTNAETVGDLLARIPGVYLWRGGWIGRPEMPNYQGRGTSSVEYWLDGVPYRPIGQDSLAIDPSLFPLSILERVEVEPLPGGLRAYLFTRQHALQAPRSRIGIAAGDREIARYQGSLERRNPSGFGFAVALDHLNVPPPGSLGAYSNSAAWVQTSYLPRPTFGVSLTWHRNGPDREPLTAIGSPADTIDPGLNGRRTDLQGRVHWRKRRDGLGSRADLFYSRSTWSSDSLHRALDQVGAVLGWRGPRTDLGLTGFWRSRDTPLDVRVHLAAAPGFPVTGAIEGAYQRHDGGRAARWVMVRAGGRLPMGVQLGGRLRTGRLVGNPSIPDDSAQSVTDKSVEVAWERGRVGLAIEYASTSRFLPRTFQQFRTIAVLDTIPGAEWVTIRGRVAPRQWLTLEGWLSDPVGDPIQGMAPRHMVATATIRSKFLRTFRSGIFDLKLQLGVERWESGAFGVGPGGESVTLEGATQMRALIQMQFDSFILYFDRSNLQGVEEGYVPGFRLPTLASTFGVRWAFLN